MGADPTPVRARRRHPGLSTARPDNYDWKLTGIAGSVTTAANSIRAWYVLREVQWEFLSNEEREARIILQARVETALAGRTVHERVTSMPFAASMWAADLDAATPHPLDTAAWSEYLMRGQRMLSSRSLADSPVFWGVSVGNDDTLRAMLDGLRGKDRAEGASARVAQDIENVDAVMETIARPATQRELEWLVARSRGLHLPNPAPSWAAGRSPIDVWDLAGIFDQVEVDPGRLGSRTISVLGTPDRSLTVEPVERHITVLAVARMEDRSIPEVSAPWLAHARQFGGVEVSSHFEIVSGDRAAKDVEKRLQLIHDQKRQFGRVDPQAEPPALDHAHRAAVAMKHEMEEAYHTESTRVYCYCRLAVGGSTPKEALELAQGLIKHYDQERIELRHLRNTEGAYREFVPGESLSSTAHLRHMPVLTHAAGLPHVSSRLGDRSGHIIGATHGASGKPCLWDLHRGMEVSARSGLTPLVGGLGSGKSNLVGFMAALETLSGVYSTVFDPSGPLARLATWEPIAKHSSALNLLDAAAGTLSPFATVVDPSLEEIAAEPRINAAMKRISRSTERGEYLAAAHNDAKAVARMERAALALDTLRGCLPFGLQSAPLTEMLLSRAVHLSTGAQDASLAEVVEHLADRGAFPEPEARHLYESLKQMMEHPRTRLFFRSGGELHADARLLVITLPGMQLPKIDADRSAWTIDERLSVATLNLAAQFAATRIYSRAMSERKFVALDEAHRLASWSSGRNLFARLERDSRKWNARVITASQDRHTALSAQDASKALIHDAFIGALDDHDQQSDALRLIGVKTGAGYEKVLSQLRSPEGAPEEQQYREFVARINGTVGRFRVDLDVLPGLRELLKTDPGGGATQLSGREDTELEWV